VSTRGRVGEDVTHGLGSRGPVTGTVPRHDRAAAGLRRDRMGRAGAQASRREAALRVLMEAYRRDLGPGSFDAR
jgi:hypothetical protein